MYDVTPMEDKVGVRGGEGDGDGCRVSDVFAALCMSHFCTYFPICESSADGGDIWRVEVKFYQVDYPSSCLVAINRGASKFDVRIWFLSVVG